MAGPYAPQGELEALNIAKEVTFGVNPGANWLGHCFKTLGGKTTIASVPRSPRASLMQPLPATGGRTWGGSLDVEATEDRIPQLLAYALGAQTAPTTALYSSTLSATCNTGVTTLPVASSLFVYAGETITIDTAGSQESVVVAGINGLNSLLLKTATTNKHNMGVAVVATGGSSCKLIKMTPGSPLPSFTAELTRIPASSPGGPVATDYLGCEVDKVTLSCAMKQGLQTKFDLVCQNDVVLQSGLAAVALSPLNPYIFEQQFTYAQIGGEVMSFGSSATLTSFSLTINNNLNKENFGFGYGNLVRSFPEQQRSVSGQMQLYFESLTQLNNFNAAQFGGNLPSISALIPLVGTDITGANNPYAIGIWLPNLKLNTLDFGDDTSKVITQTYSFTAGESTPGANDPIVLYCIGSATSIY